MATVATTTTPTTPVVKPNTYDYNTVDIGGKTYTASYANDPNNLAEIQAQIVKGGNQVSKTASTGATYDNTTGAQTNGYVAPTSQADIYNPANDIAALTAARKASALSGLKAANDQNLSDLSTANGKIEPGYYNQRNATSTDSQQASKNFAEYMAQRGLNNANGQSGSMAQADISNNVALQGNLGNLATGEATAYADNAKSVADTNVAYNNNIASSNAGIEADSMQQLINAQQQWNATKLAQANQDWSNSNTVNQQNQSQANFNTDQANTIAQQNVVNTGKNADGTSTMAGQQSDAQIAASNAATAGQLIQNTYAGQIAQGTIDAQKANTAYQVMVNASYPKEEALKIAGIVSSNAGIVLDNAAKAIANKYASSIALGTINGQTLQNAYQKLVNAGYNSVQAANIAATYAGISNTNANTNATNVNTYAAGFSGGTGSVATGGSVPTAYVSMVNGAAKQYGVDPAILAGLITIESGWNVNAHNSSSGADGLGQFLASTAKEQGVNTNDAKSSIYGAAKYLALRIKQAGSVSGGIMGYGEGTTAYLNKVMGAAKGIKLVAASTAKAAAASKPTSAINAPVANVNNVINGKGQFAALNAMQRLAYLAALSKNYSSKPVQDKNSAYIIKYIATAVAKIRAQQAIDAKKITDKNYLSPTYTFK